MNSSIISRSAHALLLAALSLAFGHPVKAADIYWDGTSASWGTVANWSTSSSATTPNPAAVPGLLDNVIFNISTVNGAQAVTFDANQSALGATFNNTGTTSLVGNASGRTFALGVNGITLASGAGAVTFGSNNVNTNVAISLGAGAQTWSNLSSSALTVNNTVSLTRATAGSITFNKVGTGEFVLNSTNLPNANGIIGSWAYVGTGASTQYAVNNFTSISGLTGTAAATAANVTDTTGAFNYDVAAVGALGAGASFNTARYTGAAGSISGAFTANGLMNVGGGNLTYSGSATIGQIGSVRELVVNTANGDMELSGIVANNAGGASGITKTGSGTLVLSNANTYTGATSVNQGTLTLSGARTVAYAAPIRVGNGTLNISAGTHDLAANAFFVGSAPGVTGTVNQTGGTVTATSSTAMLMGEGGANTAIYNMSGGNITVTGDNAFRGIIVGVGTSANATFNMSGGTINLNTTGSGAALNIGRTDSSATDVTAAFIQTGGTTTVGRLGMGGTSNARGNSTLTVTGGNFTAVNWSGADRLAGAANSVATINIGGTGNVTLNAFPTTRPGNATVTINFDGGTLRNTVASTTYMGGLTNAFIKAGGARINTTNGAITISQALLTDTLSLGGGLTKDGGNALTLTGANTFTGDTLVNAGSIAIGNNLALQNSALDTSGAGVVTTTGFTTPTLGGLKGSTNLASVITTGYSAVTNLTLNPGGTASNTYSGAIANGAANMTLTKNGTGTQILSGNNTYSGVTTINAGTLLVNNSVGSGLGSGNVAVNGGTFGGTGSVTGSVTVNSGGTLAPGASIQSLASGALTLNTGSTFGYELDQSVAPGVGADLQVVAGDLALAGTVTLSLSKIAGGTFADGTTFTLINYNGTWNNGLFTYNLSSLADDSIFTFNSQSWQIDYNAASGGSNFAADYLSSSSFVNITAIPEPSTWALLAASLSVLAVLRRRRA